MGRDGGGEYSIKGPLCSPYPSLHTDVLGVLGQQCLHSFCTLLLNALQFELKKEGHISTFLK